MSPWIHNIAYRRSGQVPPLSSQFNNFFVAPKYALDLLPSIVSFASLPRSDSNLFSIGSGI
jgi:hypothetical protein